MLTLRVNGKTYQVDAEPATPLLWVLRDSIGLTGTKYGCGIAQCGACTVHVNGRATRSCVLPVSAVLTSEITTIEGLSPHSQHPVQLAWVEQDVPQCGYCQSGQIMAAADLLQRTKDTTELVMQQAGVKPGTLDEVANPTVRSVRIPFTFMIFRQPSCICSVWNTPD